MIKILELFGGAGAPRKAIENVVKDKKIKFIDYVEYDQLPTSIYNALYDNSKKPESVVGYNLKPDILIHGSPCQDFSVAGKGIGGFKGSETRSSLMWETVRIVEELGKWKPKVIIWENVKGVLNKSRKCKECKEIVKYSISGTKPCKCGATPKTNYDNFNLYLSSLNELGYTNHYKVLNGIDFGIPQKRQRVFTISILNTAEEYKHFNFDNIKNIPTQPLSEFLEQDVNIKYYVNQASMIKAIEDGKIKIVDNEVQTITTKQWRWNNAGVIKVPLYNYNAENYVYDTNKAIGTLTATGAQSRIKIMVPKKYDDLPVFMIDNKPYHMRIITPREAWRLMGFTDKDYDKIKGLTDIQLYQVAGNSIIVQVLEAIYRELLKI